MIITGEAEEVALAEEYSWEALAAVLAPEEEDLVVEASAAVCPAVEVQVQVFKNIK
jgi:Uncharacterized conserved protein